MRDACLVTGAAGFIGSHLVSHLSSVGVKRIYAVDSLGYGAWSNLQKTSSDCEIIKIERDIFSFQESDWEPILKNVNFIFHLAAEKHNQSLNIPQRVWDVNVEATRRLFRSAAINGVKKIIFTSSLYANGRVAGQASLPEERPSPFTVYGISKLAGENLLDNVRWDLGIDMDYACFRLYFVYGPRQYSGLGYKSVIVKNFKNIIDGQSPVIFGSGLQVLDYIYVDDVVRLLAASVDTPSAGRIFNLSTGVGQAVVDLTQKMLAVAGSTGTPIYGSADWTDNTYRVGDNSATRSHFNWDPIVDINEGLARVLFWMTRV
jgi:UDP-glucose 4-epimerase